MSVKVMLRKSHPKKDGTIPVVIQVIVNRKIKVVSTDFSVKESQFKEGQEKWICKHPDAVLINDAIDKKRTNLLRLAITADATGQPIQGKKTITTFFQALKHLLT